MIGVLVTLRPVDHDRAMGVAEKAAPTFEGMPGLRSKLFTWDAESQAATNVYVWESEEAARAFFSDELRDRVTQLYGAEPEIRFVEIGALVDNGTAVPA